MRTSTTRPSRGGATRLHVVTGKGGTGKTTVAAALAMSLAADGARVLLCEVEGRQGIAQVFDVDRLGDEETRIARLPGGGEVFGLAVDAKAAFLEYLQMFYKLGRAGGLLERFGVVDFATTIAPGLRDVLLIGKVYEAAGRGSSRRRGEGYDAIVLDAPPTGRVGRFLNVNEEVAHLAKVGPVRQQADSITAMLRAPSTQVHLVTLLEEMPVTETLEAAEELRAIGVTLGTVVVNQVAPALLGQHAVAALRAGEPAALRGDLGRAGLRVGPVLVDGLVQGGLDVADRLEAQVREREALTTLGRPIVDLPLLSAGLDAGGLSELTDLLRAAEAAG